MKKKIIGLVPFDIEAAKAGAEVFTRDGRTVKILEYNLRGDAPILGVIHGENIDIVENFTAEGKNKFDGYDLHLKKVRLSGWVNVFVKEHKERFVEEVIYNTPEEATCSRLLSITNDDYFILTSTVPISWEEFLMR